MIAGEQAFRRGDWRGAIASLEPGIDWVRRNLGASRPVLYLESESLATAWLNVGEEAKALQVLEKAAQERPRYGGGMIIGAHGRFRVQARLAHEYRRLGRIQEAEAVEDELLHMLKYADADHPVVLQIKEARSGEAAAQ